MSINPNFCYTCGKRGAGIQVSDLKCLHCFTLQDLPKPLFIGVPLKLVMEALNHVN